MALETPLGNEILNNVKETLEGIRKKVGEEYFFSPRLVVRAPGVSPTYFDNPELDMAYWIVCPEESGNEKAGAHRFDSKLEVFIVGAKAGRWPVQAEDQQSPTREETQLMVCHDIKKSILVDFKRGNNAFNSNFTGARYAFTAWANFAIVTTRWEFSYIWFRERP